MAVVEYQRYDWATTTTTFECGTAQNGNWKRPHESGKDIALSNLALQLNKRTNRSNNNTNNRNNNNQTRTTKTTITTAKTTITTKQQQHQHNDCFTHCLQKSHE